MLLTWQMRGSVAVVTLSIWRAQSGSYLHEQHVGTAPVSTVLSNTVVLPPNIQMIGQRMSKMQAPRVQEVFEA